MKLKKSIIGMIHLSGNNPVERALEEIKIYEEEGLHGIIIENYHGTTDDIIETLQCVDTKMKVGINILPNNYDEALLNASFYKADFIQLDHISGTYRKNTTLDKEDYLKYRNKYKDISVFGGVWPKYYEPIAGSSLEDDLNNGKLLCDAIVVTGKGTGKSTPLDKIIKFREVLKDFPLIIGACLNIDNVSEQMKYADGAIVGSAFKPNGDTTKFVDSRLVNKFMKSI